MEKAEESFKSLVEKANEGILVAVSNGAHVYANQRAGEITGYSAAELLKTSISDLVHPDEKKPMMERYQKRLAGEPVSLHYETLIIRKDKKTVPIELTGTKIVWDGQPADAVFFRDISERKRVEKELVRVRRALRILGSINQALIHAADAKLLFNEVCRIAVEQGGFRLAWVGLVEQDEAKNIRPVAHAGFDSGYIESAKLTWSETNPRGRGPGGVAVRTSAPCLARNILDDPSFVPWREEAIRRGYQSVLALPLVSGGQAFGVLGIYSSEADSFDAEEVGILKEVADDMAFGVEALRLRVERSQAEEKLRESREKYRNLVENISEVLLTLDLNGTITYISPVVQRIFGYLPDEVVGRNFSRFIHSSDLARVLEGFKLRVEGEYGANAFRLLAKDGKERYVRTTQTPIFKDKLVIGFNYTMTDLTELKQAEDEIRKSKERYLSALDGMLEGCMILDREWRYLYVNDVAARHGHEQKQNLIGKTMLEKYPGVEKSEIFAAYQRCMQNRSPERIESAFNFPDGSVNWYKFSINPVDEGIFILSMDITEQKLAEEKVKEQIKMLKEINDLAVGRELKMIELEKEISRLKKT